MGCDAFAPDDYCVVKSTTAMATERLTAETVATVDSTPIRRSAIANAMMMGVAVIGPICASLIASLAILRNRRMQPTYDGGTGGTLR